MKVIPNLDKLCTSLQKYLAVLSLGMKLTITHGVLKFKQFDWTKKYIDFNTEKEQTLLIVLRLIFLN